MSSLAIRIGAFLFGFSAVLLSGIPEAPAALDQNTAAQSTPAPMSARERWAALSPEQRQRLQQRFERLQQLDEGQRQELERRAQKRKRTEEKVLKQLSTNARKRLMSTPPEHRRQLVDEMVEAEMRDKGRRIEAKLPKDLRAQLVAASPEERRRQLGQFKRDTRERISLVLVEDTAKALGYSQQDIARFMKLPIDRRMKLVLELRKEFTGQQIAASGLPPGLTQTHWNELDQLAPREYFAEVMRLRDEGLFGSRAVTDPATRGERTGGREISRGLRHDPQERLDLSDLPPHRRRAVLDQRRRARVMTEVRKLKLFTPEQLEALEAMSENEFFLNARRMVQDLRRGEVPDLQEGKPGRERPDRERARSGNRGADQKAPD